jgi:hypothetical protein
VAGALRYSYRAAVVTPFGHFRICQSFDDQIQREAGSQPASRNGRTLQNIARLTQPLGPKNQAAILAALKRPVHGNRRLARRKSCASKMPLR